MRDKKVLVSMRIDPEEKERLSRAAEDHKMDLTDLFRDGAHLLAGFSPWFLKVKMREIIKDSRLPPAAVIETMILAVLAKAQVEYEKTGEDTHLAEIKLTRGGYLLGQERFNLLLEQERKAQG